MIRIAIVEDEKNYILMNHLFHGFRPRRIHHGGTGA